MNICQEIFLTNIIIIFKKIHKAHYLLYFKSIEYLFCICILYVQK